MPEKKELTLQIISVQVMGGTGKVSKAQASVVKSSGEVSAPFTAKFWTSDDIQPGTGTFLVEEKIDERNDNKPEKWISKPKPVNGGNRRGGGGVAKADPEKLALEKEKHEDFKKKWSIDRQMEAHRQASIAAQVILKAAVELEVANLGNLLKKDDAEASMNRVQAYAQDLAMILADTHETIFKSIAAREVGGE